MKHRYQIDRVWGCMEGRLDMGAVVVDTKGPEDSDDPEGEGWQSWQIAEPGRGVTGGFSGIYLGPVQ